MAAETAHVPPTERLGEAATTILALAAEHGANQHVTVNDDCWRCRAPASAPPAHVQQLEIDGELRAAEAENRHRIQRRLADPRYSG